MQQLRAMIFGGNGQDGQLITKHLLDQRYQIYSLGRNFDNKHLNRIESEVKFIRADLLACDVEKLLDAYKPNLILYCAAFHGPSGTVYEDSVQHSLIINTMVPIKILEYCKSNIKTKFIYFNSSKIFNFSQALRISEKSDRVPSCIYSLEKEITYKALAHFRSQFGVSAYNFWFFNHESPLRPKPYFIPTLINILKQSINNPRYKGHVRSLDFYCDWGCADEYMKNVVHLFENFEADDYVIASGKTLSGRELAEKLFSLYALDYRDHISPAMQHDDLPPDRWYADITKLIDRSGVPLRSIFDVCDDFMDKGKLLG
ncbi:GDP-mannose 4,6-dehydratase [Planktomarina temperata]|nr:GDP-mannose 4,6-dehydratase [Planktomarina temperata]